ncbi:MAG: hypothetical protein JW847_05595 [Candidatus Omnitrophica bacterium]|nr:hypothetical protein [Candidatus Omnitrophota bacterium]
MDILKNKTAQTAVELAVFGSILIFVMGSIIKTVVSQSQQHGALLRATRMALTLSHLTTEEEKMAGRNSASVLIVEDRLTAASSKYGAIDRIPFMTQGSGTHSRHLFMPVDFGDTDDLPLFDLFVNGKHFVFSTAGFKYVNLAANCEDVPPCPADCPICNVGTPCYCRGQPEAPIDGIPVEGIPAGADYWEPDCLESTTVTTQTNSCADTSAVLPDVDPPYECPDPICLDCSPVSTQTYQDITTQTQMIGCAKLYTVVENHPLIPDWCDGGSRPCPATCPTGPGVPCNLSVDERFNLDRANATDPDGLDGLPGSVTVPVGERPGFSWQWFLVAPVDETIVPPLNYDEASLMQSPILNMWTTHTTRVAAGEGIVLPGGEAEAKNISLDADYDLKLEYIMANVEENNVQPNIVDDNGVIIRIGVMDPQLGDIDMTYDDSDKLKGIEPFGFTRDLKVYTFVRGNVPDGGTYFEIDEGQLFAADTRQFIRTASKKDQVDLIERVFRLSRNTGGYCLPDGTKRSGAEFREFYGILNNSEPNPVEACENVTGACFNGANINLTCMDTTTDTIFIRSRIQDLHGRKWVTETGSDPYVNFDINN